MSSEQLMAMAIAEARKGIAAGQAPFGAVIARRGRVVARAHNTVWQAGDATAHAEINAIRSACGQLATIDLSGCEIFATCEPCPMCLSAIHWARIHAVCYGASIADARAAGFSELTISAADMTRIGQSPVKVVPGVLVDRCRALFQEWLATDGHRSY